MITFNSIDIRDYGVIASANLRLDNQGLVLIIGKNNDTTAASSNGSGKSTVFKALSWCLFGVTVSDGKSNDSTIRIGAKSATVTLEFTDGENTYKIVRNRTKNSTKLSLYTNGESTTGRTIKDTEQFIQDKLGLDWNSFRNTVLYGQGDIKRFADPHTSDTERKQVLKKVLGLEIYDKAKAETSLRIRNLKQEIQELTKNHAVIDALLEDAISQNKSNDDAIINWAQELVNKKTELQKKRAAAEETLSKMEEPDVETIGRLLKLIEDKLSELDGIDDKYYEMVSQENEAKNRITSTVMDINATNKKLEEIKMELRRNVASIISFRKEMKEDVDSEECPVCGSTDGWDKETRDAHVGHKISELEDINENIRSDIIALNATLAKHTAAKEQRELEYETARSEVADLNSAIDGLKKLKRKQRQYSVAYNDALMFDAKIREQRAKIDAISEKIDTVYSEKCPYQDKKMKLESLIKSRKQEFRKSKNALSKAQKRLEPLLWWREAFGNKGLPSMAMDSIMPILSENSNNYLNILTDGDITVDINSEMILKSGEKTDSITIIPTVEGLTDVSLSGGQQCKVGLAVDLGLMDIVSSRANARINMLLLDEVLDGLDSEGKQRVVELLKYLRTAKSSVFVISHDDVVQDEFERVITIFKNNKSSTIMEK